MRRDQIIRKQGGTGFYYSEVVGCPYDSIPVALVLSDKARQNQARFAYWAAKAINQESKIRYKVMMKLQHHESSTQADGCSEILRRRT